MIQWILFVLILCFAGCSSSNSFAIEKADPQKLQASVSYLADSIGGRPYNDTAKLNRAGNYIQESLFNLGLNCQKQAFQTPKYEYFNVVCDLPGRSDTIFVVGAHYDTYDNLPGADDNASGVAGLIETARILKQSKPHYSLKFVAFTLEEPPFFRTPLMGSHVFAKSILGSSTPIRGMVSLEMIGYFTDSSAQDYPTVLMRPFYPSQGNFIASVTNFNSSKLADFYQKNMEELGELQCVQLTAPASIPGVDFSDHLNFWKYDLQAFMITNTAFNRNKEYHTPNDRSERLDYKRMGFTVNGLTRMLMQKF